MIKLILIIFVVFFISLIFKKYYPKIILYLKKIISNPIFRTFAIRGIIRILRLLILKK